MVFISLFLFLGSAFLSLFICMTEYLESKRLERLTEGPFNPPVRQLVGVMMRDEDFWRTVIALGMVFVAILAVTNPTPPIPTPRMFWSRAILTLIPVALAFKALKRRHNRRAVIEATRHTPEFEHVRLAPYLNAIWQTMAVLIVDMRSGIIAEASEASHEMFGFPPDTLPGLTVESLIPEALRHSHEAQRAEYARHPSMRMMMQHRFLAQRMDGSTFYVGIHLVPMLGNSRVLAVLAEFAEFAEEKH